MMNIATRFKSLPVKTRRLLGIGMLLGLFAALPLFIWAIVTQNFNIQKKAASGEPGVCVAQNNVITVTPNTDVNGTCHNIQTAIDAATGDGYTIRLTEGNYDITHTLSIDGKSNLKIVGDGVDKTVLSFNSDGIGIKVASSSGGLYGLAASGIVPPQQEFIRIDHSADYHIAHTNIYSTKSDGIAFTYSNYIYLDNVNIQSSGFALSFSSVNHISVQNSKFHDSQAGLFITNAEDVNIENNLFNNNYDHALMLQTISFTAGSQNSKVLHNTFINNGSNGATAAIVAYGTIDNLDFKNNIVAFNKGPGIHYEQGSLPQISFSFNDIYSNNPNYVGLPSQFGTNGNIASEPQLNNLSGIYCPLAGSPVLYGDVAKGEYMGYISSCGNNPSPTPIPTPVPTITPVPSCRPRPACLDATPGCLPPEPVDGWCPTPTPTAASKPGDVNGDGIVNIVDIGIVIDNYRIVPIPNPKADLNNDGIANIVDIGIIIDNYLK